MIRIFLNITLILLTFCACYFENIYLLFWPPRVNDATIITFRAQQAFTYDQKKALSLNRQKAHSKYIPVFRYIPGRVEKARKKLRALSNEFSVYKAVKGRGSENLVLYLEERLGVNVSKRDVIRIIKYRDLKQLLEGILTIQESVLQHKIIDDTQYLRGKKSVEIQNLGSNETAVFAIDDVTTLEKARFSMQTKIHQLFWQVDKKILDPMVQMSIATLEPNLIYDQFVNQRRLEKLDRQFPTKTINYRPGDVLVAAKKIITEEDVRLLTSYRKQMSNQIYRDALWILFTILFIVVLFNLFVSKIVVGRSYTEPPCHILLSLLVIQIIILKSCLIFTPFPIYMLPFSSLPLLVISLNHGRITAIGTTVVAAFLVSLFCGRIFEIILYFIFGGLSAVLVASRIRKRWLILIPALLVGFINVTSVIAFTIDWQATFLQLESLPTIGMDIFGQIFDASLIENIIWAFVGGVAAGPLALLLLPLLEVSWQTASTFKLNRYTDLQRPLLKKLLQEARGTYQHSMTVAHLAQSAGEAIGANTLLLRIGAYYHDIGKITKPGFFIENQFDGHNPHDSMDPEDSVNLIIDHVRDGMKIGQESGLPKVVVDLILQHHGTHLIEYFYSLATEANPKSLVQEDDFRYPGPKPQSIEAAILMIADSAEAASRSLKDPTRKKLEKMVRLILVKRIIDGQFSECDLRTRDIEKIVQTLVDSLEASFHSRIRYPGQSTATPRQKGGWRIGATSEKQKKDRAFRL
jgi:putative nucleotidyltransferase with HDIG domain